MKVDEVPQDNLIHYQGAGKRAIYAVNERGEYTTVPTSGWEVEEIVLSQALADYDEQAVEARQRVLRGKSSPIEYFMYKRRMDAPVLAQAMGLFKWQVKRHLKAKVFQRLDEAMLNRYARILRVDVRRLTHFEQMQGEL
jgi:hypothetical protein